MFPGVHERGASDENRAAEAERHPPPEHPPRVAVPLESVQLHRHPDRLGHEEHRHPDEPGGGATATADQVCRM